MSEKIDEFEIKNDESYINAESNVYKNGGGSTIRLSVAGETN